MLLLIAASVGPRFSDTGLSNDGSHELAIELNKFSQKAKQSIHKEIDLSSKKELSGSKTGLRNCPGLGRRRSSRQTHKGTRQYHIYSFWAPIFLSSESHRVNECWWGESHLLNIGEFCQLSSVPCWFFTSPNSLTWNPFLKFVYYGEMWEVGHFPAFICLEYKWIQIRSHVCTTGMWFRECYHYLQKEENHGYFQM